jgi:hypothetical protein
MTANNELRKHGGNPDESKNLKVIEIEFTTPMNGSCF